MDIKYKKHKRTTDRGTIIYIRGYSRILCKFLDELVGHGAYEKHVPKVSFTAPKEFIIGLIDGFISGDGSLTESGITASSCSKELIDGINMLLARLDIFSYISITKYDNENREIKANYNTFSISIRAQWANLFKLKIVTLVNKNKNDKLILMKPSSKIHPNYIEQNDVVLDDIVEINNIDKNLYKKLYDLTIPETFNFIICNL